MCKTALAEIGGRDLIVLLDGNAAAVVGLFKTFSYPGEAVKVIELWVASLKKKKKKNVMKQDETWHRKTFIITGLSWENPFIRRWCDGMGKFSHYWPLCKGSTSQCRHSSNKGPVMQRWCLLGAVSLNKLFNKQASCWWFEATWCCDIITKFIRMIRSFLSTSPITSR